MNEHDYEPMPGLPAPLPAGETILWQGAPDWETLARRAMRVRVVGGIFPGAGRLGYRGQLSPAAVRRKSRYPRCGLAALAVVAIALLTLFAWLVARTTIYTITTRRVVMRFGIALPITIQIAFPMIDAAGLQSGRTGRRHRAGTAPGPTHRLPCDVAACAPMEADESRSRHCAASRMRPRSRRSWAERWPRPHRSRQRPSRVPAGSATDGVTHVPAAADGEHP